MAAAVLGVQPLLRAVLVMAGRLLDSLAGSKAVVSASAQDQIAHTAVASHPQDSPGGVVHFDTDGGGFELQLGAVDGGGWQLR